MNKAILIGNLGRDAELRDAGGHPKATFSLATSERFKNRAGERQERTDWHNCVMWGTRAEALYTHLVKGTKVAVVGRIQTRSWEVDGVKKYMTEITVDDLEFVGGGGGGGGQRQQSPDVGDDDIAF